MFGLDSGDSIEQVWSSIVQRDIKAGLRSSSFSTVRSFSRKTVSLSCWHRSASELARPSAVR